MFSRWGFILNCVPFSLQDVMQGMRETQMQQKDTVKSVETVTLLNWVKLHVPIVVIMQTQME